MLSFGPGDHKHDYLDSVILPSFPKPLLDSEILSPQQWGCQELTCLWSGWHYPWAATRLRWLTWSDSISHARAPGSNTNLRVLRAALALLLIRGTSETARGQQPPVAHSKVSKGVNDLFTNFSFLTREAFR